MKKITIILMLMVILLSTYTGFAEEKEEFTIRNGIKFGMTKTEIKKLESLPVERDTIPHFIDFGPGEILGIPSSTVEYLFDDSGRLNNLLIVLGKDAKSSSQVYLNYNKAVEALILKYGEPLDIQSGQTYKYVAKSLGTLLPVCLSIWKMTTGSYQYDYKEWAVQYDIGLVKIECLWYFSNGKNGPSSRCSIEYMLFDNIVDTSHLNDI